MALLRAFDPNADQWKTKAWRKKVTEQYPGY